MNTFLSARRLTVGRSRLLARLLARLLVGLAIGGAFASAFASFGCDPNPPVKLSKGSGGAVGMDGSGGSLASGGATGSGGVEGTGGMLGSGGATGSGGAETSSGGAAGGSVDTGSGGANGGTVGTGTGGAMGSGGAAGGSVGTGSGGASGGGGQAGSNLITNGDFSMGEMFWGVDVASVSHSIMNGAECLIITGGGPAVNLGWAADAAAPLSLPAGASYRLSYRVSSSGPLSITLQPKVGLSVKPYTADFPAGSMMVNDPVSATLQTQMHTFTVQAGDTQAGLAFTITPSTGSQMTTVCFDDVSLIRQ